MKNKPLCPRCKRPNDVVGSSDGTVFYCERCKAMFDNTDPNEGGDYSDHNPAARLEREERKQRRRA